MNRHSVPFRRLALLVLGLAASAPAVLAAVPPAPTPPIPDTLDLKTAVGYALEHNFTILQAQERIREQEGLIVTVTAQALPNASLAASYSRNQDSLQQIGTTTASDQYWSIALQVRQTLYAGGGISAALDAQRLVRASALLDLKATINTALLDVRTKFYSVLFAREQIKVQEESVELLQQQLKDAKNRFDAGTVSNFEVLRADVELANAQPPLITARNNYRLAIDELRQSLGYSNTTPEDLRKVPAFDGTLTYAPVTYDLQKSLETARSERPELQRLRKIEEAGDANVRVQQAGYRPNVALVAGYELIKANQFSSFGQSLDGWLVGVQSSWAIFDGRATTGRVTQARSQLAQARLNTLQQALAIEVEVRRAISTLQEAGELAEAAQKVVAEGEEALRLANARYTAGTATQLDVLSAQVALTQARNNQLQANYSFNVALATLREAIGNPDAYAPGN